MLTKYIDVINQHSRGFKLENHKGKCPARKLFASEVCVGGDYSVIKLPFVNDDFISEQDVVYLLEVTIFVKRARYEWEREWRWEPGENARARLHFYHHDCEQLLQYTAEWLEQHADLKSPKAECAGSEIYTIKCEPIGRVSHYTSMEKFKDE